MPFAVALRRLAHVGVPMVVRDEAGENFLVEPNDMLGEEYSMCCARGMSKIQHIYGETRLQTPLRRTGATYKDEMGRVEIDYDKCIGCRMCMAACPYNARTFNWAEPVRVPDFNYGDSRVPVRGKGVMEKCTLCKERVDSGDEPMCVVCCPMRARVFGDLDDPNSEISRLRRQSNVRILLEDKGTKPQVFYLS